MLNYYKSTLIRNAQGGPLISVFVKISVCYCNFSFGLDFFFQRNDDTPSTKRILKLRNTFSLLRYEGERYDSPRSCDVLTKTKPDSRDSSNFKTGTQLFRERLSEKMCWSIRCYWHCRCRIFYCCFPLTLANISLWPLVPFFQISLKNSELKTTHNTFRDCREHFFRQPFSK